MALDGGKGAVTTKNQPLWPGQTDYTAEALTAAPKADGSGYWVLTFRPGTGNLIVFEFDAHGLVTGSAREYALGTSVSRFDARIGYGTLNFSRDYQKLLIMAGNHCTGTTACSRERGLVRLVDFDNSTSTPTLRFEWNNATNQLGTAAGDSNRGYSADFSPDEQYVYTSALYPGRLFRYKISGKSTSTQVKASEEFIAITNSATASPAVYNGSGQVRRGPDGRMYVANYGHGAISVIRTPDAATAPTASLAQRQAAVGWVYNGQSLSAGTTSRYGLPQVVTRFVPQTYVY
ncbi:hypothetical protein EG850_12260 [Gulosibacter macacae]|uniref:SMP-30/Gluconolactonase/LRE-like region domain-containing protein n=1 Tax=Gulosibacter macacae TaxID=2488791 RepID=A0A3P3VW64_9MICO|nr:hypothetical protein [Gulosibacter macacae]RRJ85689.1 hypothetical protein EG850_12260 [Gulosibacter macacae]